MPRAGRWRSRPRPTARFTAAAPAGSTEARRLNQSWGAQIARVREQWKAQSRRVCAKRTMRLNAFFPTRDIGSDPAKIRDWAQAAEDLGYAGIEVADHVFGATARDGWTPLYNETDPFHETFVTLGFLAAVTSTIRLSSGVLILPQRQT